MSYHIFALFWPTPDTTYTTPLRHVYTMRFIYHNGASLDAWDPNSISVSTCRSFHPKAVRVMLVSIQLDLLSARLWMVSLVFRFIPNVKGEEDQFCCAILLHDTFYQPQQRHYPCLPMILLMIERTTFDMNYGFTRFLKVWTDIRSGIQIKLRTADQTMFYNTVRVSWFISGG